MFSLHLEGFLLNMVFSRLVESAPYRRQWHVRRASWAATGRFGCPPLSCRQADLEGTLLATVSFLGFPFGYGPVGCPVRSNGARGHVRGQYPTLVKDKELGSILHFQCCDCAPHNRCSLCAFGDNVAIGPVNSRSNRLGK